MFYRANYVLLFIVNGVGLALTITTVFQCKPVSAVFQLEKQTKDVCTKEFISAISTAPYNIATDIALIFIPIPLWTRIRLPSRQRIILVLTFGAGILVIVTDIVQITFLQTSARVQLRTLHSYHTVDISNGNYFCGLPIHDMLKCRLSFNAQSEADFSTGHTAYSAMWAVVEVNLTIICASVPSLKPLAAQISPKLIHGGDTEDQTDHTTIDGGAAGSREPEGEMMTVLTRKRELGPPERYPTNIKLLNLLNLRPRRMLTLTNKQSIPPNIFVTTYFFLWGSSYGLVTTLRLKFGVARFGPWHSHIGQGVYWLGYLPAPVLVGRLVMKKFGFYTAFISALYIYAMGALWGLYSSGQLPFWCLGH